MKANDINGTIEIQIKEKLDLFDFRFINSRYS